MGSVAMGSFPSQSAFVTMGWNKRQTAHLDALYYFLPRDGSTEKPCRFESVITCLDEEVSIF
jgi:hypothetical protein